MASIVECEPNAVYCVSWGLRPSSGPLQQRFESAIRSTDEACKGEESAVRHPAIAYPTKSDQERSFERQFMTQSAAAAELHAWVEEKRGVEATHC